jgi:indole-3-glycerol phosphate synthase
MNPRRLSQAISEGDGISVIPVLEGEVEALAARAEEAGAEAIAVRAEDVERARARTGLPILARAGDPQVAAAAGADAIVVAFEAAEDDGELERLDALVRELDLECAIDVRDEEELEEALERIDPDLVLISERDADQEEEALERTLDLLADVPAGKLVVSEARIESREQVLALERAGIDAILVHGLAAEPDFEAVLEELVHGPEAGR